MRTRHKLSAALSALLAALVILSALASCGRESGPTAESTGDNAGDSSAVTEPVETARLTADVPAADYNGYTFKILTCGNWGADWTEIYEFTADELNGEALNDAVYTRNMAIEERFNIDINELHHMGTTGATGKGKDFIQRSVAAGDNAYDLVLMGTYDAADLAAGGYLLEMNTEVPHIDLTKPWWDQKALVDLALGGRNYYITGDITMIDNECTFCLLFNKRLIEDYGLDDPYKHVLEGSWTIDEFVGMASGISVDVDGDGEFTDADKYGYCIWHEAMRGMVSACGGRFCSVNSDGELELTFNTERNVNMLTKFMALAYDRTTSYSIYHSPDSIEKMFANDQVLFYSRYLCIIKKYRNMETDFGILPYPKYDEIQDDYYSSVSPYGCSFICMPTVLEDADMSGAVLESMACESMYTVTGAYYDITLQGKILRDEESSEMLDIILGSRIFDLGWIYGVGNYHTELLKLFYNSSYDFASMYQKNEAAALAKIAEINETFTG